MPRSLSAAAAAAAVVITLAATAVITTATPAGAICAPSPAIVFASYGAEQVRYASTCDGDGFYAGQAYDPVQDQACAAVRYRNHGTSGAGWVQGQACTTGAFTSYNAQGGPFDVRVCKGASTTICTGWVLHHGF